MSKYVKKPIPIEAVQWAGDNLDEIKELAGEHQDSVMALNNGLLGIHTLEGTMTASIGDYIIKGVQGELYPCRRDIFEATYEEVRSDGE